MLIRRSSFTQSRSSFTPVLALLSLLLTNGVPVLRSETPPPTEAMTLMVRRQMPDPITRRLLDHSRALARQRIPYLYGGTSTHGMDCSASVQHLFQRMGNPLPRTSEAQANHLARRARLWRVAPWESENQVATRLQPGDLMFWTNPDTPNRIGHVMMFVGLEADGRLRLWGARGRGKTGLTGSGVDFYSYRPGDRRGSRLVAYGRPDLP